MLALLRIGSGLLDLLALLRIGSGLLDLLALLRIGSGLLDLLAFCRIVVDRDVKMGFLTAVAPGFSR